MNMSLSTRVAIYAYIFSIYFDAPIRYTLDSVGLASAMIVRDVAGVLVASLLIWRTLRLKSSNLTTMLLFLSFISGLIVAVSRGLSINQLLFSLKLGVPFLVGIYFGYMIKATPNRIIRFAEYLFWCSLGGIVISFFIDLPWHSLSYSVGGIEVQGALSSSTAGLERLSGFARSNHEAAGLLILAWTIVCLRIKSIPHYLGFSLFTLSGVALTLSKIGFVALLIVSTWQLYCKKLQTDGRNLFETISLLSLGISLALPFSIKELTIDNSNLLQIFLLNSMKDRIENGWGQILRDIDNLGGHIFGIGFGSTGAGARYFGSDQLYAIDNVGVFLYSWVGLFALVYYYSVIRLILKSRTLFDPRFPRLCIMVVCILGMTSNIIESASYMLILGGAVGFCGNGYRPNFACLQTQRF